MCVPCRKELAEAHRTNKPCGKCHFYLLISKTFVEAGKSNSKKKWSDPKKEELMFANAEEEFFYEVRPSWFICLHVIKDLLLFLCRSPSGVAIVFKTPCLRSSELVTSREGEAAPTHLLMGPGLCHMLTGDLGFPDRSGGGP